jgi:hypothetical protein
MHRHAESGCCDSKSTTGAYRQDKTDIEQEVASPQLRASKASKRGRSKIGIVAPKHRQDQPITIHSFSEQPNNNHIRSDSADVVLVRGISQLSGTNEPLVQQAIVSSLHSLQQQSETYLHSSTGFHVSTSSFDSWDQDQIPTGSDVLLAGSPSDDGSSIYSKCSLSTSMRARTSLIQLKRKDFYEPSAGAVFPVECPVAAGIFADEASVAQSSDDARAEIDEPPHHNHKSFHPLSSPP